jgi:hypothetical protein
MAGLDEVVAGVEVAVVLQGQAMAAGGVEDAHPGGPQSEPGAHRGLESLDEDRPTSLRTHSSKTAVRKFPHCSGVTLRAETPVPSWWGLTTPACIRSMAGMNWIQLTLASSRRKR